MMDDTAREADEVSRALWPTISEALAGRSPELQGAVLADLTACWIAGHIILGDPNRTVQLREEMLATQVATIRDLIEMYVGRR